MTVPTLSAESSSRTEADLRRQYGYAIVRIDEFLGDDIPIERRITVKKVVNDPDEADQEVERLNRLQAGKKVRYFSQITRLEHSETQGNQESAQANRISAFPPRPDGRRHDGRKTGGTGGYPRTGSGPV